LAFISADLGESLKRTKLKNSLWTRA